VYRAARSLYPLGDDAKRSSSTVIVRIDQLKAAPASEICADFADGQICLLIRQSGNEAGVQRYSLFAHEECVWPSEPYRIMRVYPELHVQDDNTQTLEQPLASG